MNQYINLFIDQEYPIFIDKYLNTKTLKRLKGITQFCGCDYTELYRPKFLYTRYDHSLVVAHMTWHFTKNKKETIVALLHDIGTPCFAHCIDYVFGDYLNQETSEKKLTEIIQDDEEIQKYLKDDKITLKDLEDFSPYNILENKTPQLCTDRLDGVLHTCYIWLSTNNLKEIKEVYKNLEVLKNEKGLSEIGFSNLEVAEKFAQMVYIYATELQSNKDKYTMKYISEMIKLAFKKQLLTLEDLYTKKEADICNILETNFSSWKKFKEAKRVIGSKEKPKNCFYIFVECKRRNTIPLVKTSSGIKRINDISSKATNIYDKLESFKDQPYGYVEEIKELN